MNVLANDGISPAGKDKLESEGFNVVTDHIDQEKLADYINENDISVLLVRSATKVRKDLIDSCPGLKFIGRGGVGMDNIDVKYARDKHITVANTPASSSRSVAELVMAHLFSLARFTYDSNRQMPEDGHREFKALKKKYGGGFELRGKTLGIIGFGRIGNELAKYALGCGMRVICPQGHDSRLEVSFEIVGFGEVNVNVEEVPKETLLRESDAISLHIPKQEGGKAAIGKREFEMMKKGSVLVNAARGGVVDEEALIEALDNGTLAAAALDVFEDEPTPRTTLLRHPKIALSPHIGAATDEAQDRIGLELADLIIAEFKPVNG